MYIGYAHCRRARISRQSLDGALVDTFAYFIAVSSSAFSTRSVLVLERIILFFTCRRWDLFLFFFSIDRYPRKGILSSGTSRACSQNDWPVVACVMASPSCCAVTERRAYVWGETPISTSRRPVHESFTEEPTLRWDEKSKR